MLQLPKLIEKLSDVGCSDIDSLDLAIELVQIDRLKEHFQVDEFNEIKLKNILDGIKFASKEELELLSLLSGLTIHQRQCYIRDVVGMEAARETANLLGINRSMVYRHREHAEVKIRRFIERGSEGKDALDIKKLLDKYKKMQGEVSDELAEILWKLSWRQRTCWLMKQTTNLTLQQIADELELEKDTVKTYIKIANNRIEENYRDELVQKSN